MNKNYIFRVFIALLFMLLITLSSTGCTDTEDRGEIEPDDDYQITDLDYDLELPQFYGETLTIATLSFHDIELYAR